MRPRPDNFLPLFIAEYLADTAHLTRDQHGGYLLLLMAYWRRGGPLADDDGRLAQIAKASPAEWRRLRGVLAEFFLVRDGQWHSKRSDAELRRAAEKMAAKSRAGSRGAAKRWQTHSQADDEAIANECPLSLPLESNSEPSLEFVGSPAGKPKQKRAVAWSDEQSVPAEWITAARAARAKRGLPDCDYELEADKFSDWALNAGPKRNWRAAFVNWCRNAKGTANGTGFSGANQRGPSARDRLLETIRQAENVRED